MIRHLALIHFQQLALVHQQPFFKFLTVCDLGYVVTGLLADPVRHTVEETPFGVPTITTPAR